MAPTTILFDDFSSAVLDAKRRCVSVWHDRSAARAERKPYASGCYDGLIDDLGYTEAGGYEYVPRDDWTTVLIGCDTRG